ncbi:MAG TPA: GAF domain-containing protein [Anaerolineales bacterium]|nr:GAF domain-containing protein [Anaerolineales bacterium]
MSKVFSLDRLLARTGDRYIISVIAVAQLIAILGAIPGLLSINANAEFTPQQMQLFSWVMPVSIVLTYLVLLGISWGITPTARKRLSKWLQGSHSSTTEEEYKAWREITSLTWRYGMAAGFVIFFINIIPAYLITWSQSEVISSVFQPTSINSPVPAYVLLGGTVSLLGFVILSVLMIERLILPARLVLVPTEFDTQLEGRFGALLIGKFQILILGLIAISILLIAPIGYQQTVRILYSEVSSLESFSNLQVQLILFSSMALLLGAGFSYYVSKSLSDPIRELINTFLKIEQGDLATRAPVNATDELGIVTMHFNRMVAQLEGLQNTLEQKVAERTKQLTATNEVGRVAASILDPDELLNRVINLLSERFGYYFAAIYLLDPSEKWAELRDATGDAGHVLKNNHHRLEVAGRSMVGTAIRERSARIAQASSSEKQRFENPLLPYTRSEIALPLLAGDRVLGALDVQSTKESDFGPELIETMENMAAQVAIALENARLYQEAQRVIKEMRTVQQQYLQEGWSGYSAQHDELEYGVGDDVLENSTQMEVPISLRDQILGQIVLEGNSEWTQDQRSLVDAVATQAAIALENARLVSESRQVAVRERMLAEINSKIWSSATIDGILQTAAKELGRRMNASQVTVELKLDDDANS